MSVEIASLRIEVDATSAAPAKVSLDDLVGSGQRLEQQATKIVGSQRSVAAAHGLSGTAAGQAERSMRSLVGVYGNLRDSLGRFTAVDGSFRTSQEATALMAIRNAQAQAALAKEHEKAASQAAALAKRYDALRAELDPLAAIQTTLTRRTDLLNEAMAKGVITADQHAAMLSKVTRAALAGVQGVDKYTGGLRNGGQHLTQFSFQLNDIVTGLTSGQKPMQVLAQQSGQIIQIFQQAAVEAGGFKAAIKGLTAEIVPMLVTFGPWIAGLTAVGAAVFYVVDQHNKQAKAIDDATKRLEEQRKALGQISPLLDQAKMAADLAADGQRNFDEHVRKTNTSLAEQIRLQRVATLNGTNDALLKAGEELRKNQEIFDKLNKPGTQMGFSTGVGGFSTISAATAVNKESELYKKAAVNLKEARDKVDALNQRLAQQGQAPDPWFGKYTEGATKATAAVRDVTKATEEYTRTAAPIQEDQLLKAANVVWPEAAAAAEAYKSQQDALRAATNDNIKTFDEATAGQIRFSSKLEIAAADMEASARVARELRFDIEDIGRAISQNDWATGFAGLLRVLDQVKKAFDASATSLDKMQALAGVGMGIGSLIGGKGGAAISGASSGALAGFQLAGPWGAAAGAALGGLSGLFGASAEKAQKKIEALTKAVDDLRTDNKTSSGSIAAALAEANSNWNSDLEYSSAMLTALRSIDGQIGRVANALSRSITSGGLLSTAGLGLGTSTSKGSALFGLANLFLGGSKTTTELLDQGLNFNASTYGDIVNGGVSGSTYADLATTKTKKFLGVAYSTKVSTSTVNGSIDPSLLGQISGVIQALGDGVLSAAAVFGVEAAKAAESALGSAVVDLGKLSLKGLKSDEIAEVLNATFDKVGDQLAAAGVPGLDKLADVGEGAFETLTRLAREYQVVDTALASIGKTFGQIGLESIAARDELVKLFGGTDAFTSSTSFFAQNFLTDAEQLAPVIKAVNDNLRQYGLTAESSRDQFAKLVLAQDLTTEAGRATYAALLAVAPAFDKVASAAEAAATTATEAAKAAEEAAAKAFNDDIDRQIKAMDAAAEQASATTSAVDDLGSALTATITKFNDFATSLLDFADSLKPDLAGGGAQAQYDYAKRAFNTAVATGDYENIASLGKAFADASKEASGSQQAYQRDLAAIRQAALGSITATKISSFQAQITGGQLAALVRGDQDQYAYLKQLRAAGLPGFASGGSFEVGGMAGTDQNVLSVNGVPFAGVNGGEAVNVSRKDVNEALLAEIRSLKDVVASQAADIKALKSSNDKIERTLTNVTEGGRAMQTEAAA